MMNVKISDETGDFAEDKDVAAAIRDKHIRAAVTGATEIVLDFTGVRLVRQSFVHALISDVLRGGGEVSLKYIVFKGCTESVKGIIETVVQYSLEAADGAG